MYQRSKGDGAGNSSVLTNWIALVVSLYAKAKSKCCKNAYPSFLCVNVTFPIRGPAKLNFTQKLLSVNLCETFLKYDILYLRAIIWNLNCQAQAQSHIPTLRLSLILSTSWCKMPLLVQYISGHSSLILSLECSVLTRKSFSEEFGFVVVRTCLRFSFISEIT